jgi:hypothetical protein
MAVGLLRLIRVKESTGRKTLRMDKARTIRAVCRRALQIGLRGISLRPTLGPRNSAPANLDLVWRDVIDLTLSCVPGDAAARSEATTRHWLHGPACPASLKRVMLAPVQCLAQCAHCRSQHAPKGILSEPDVYFRRLSGLQKMSLYGRQSSTCSQDNRWVTPFGFYCLRQ